MKINDIAKLAGVSVSTVSKVMNNKDESISKDTRVKVIEVAKKYHYGPYSKTRLKNTKSLIIGLIVKDIEENISLIKGINEVANSKGYSVIIKENVGDEKLELEHITTLISLSVDAIIVEPVSQENIQYIIDKGIKFKIINSDVNGKEYIDYKDFGSKLLRYLINQGHRKFVYIRGESFFSDNIIQGIEKELKNNGIEKSDLLCIEFNKNINLNTLYKDKFSAFIVEDFMSSVVLRRTILNSSYGVPNEFSILTFTNNLTFYKHSSISTVLIPDIEFGRNFISRLISELEEISLPESANYEFILNHKQTIGCPINDKVKKIISVGSINIDSYMKFDRLPTAGESTSTTNAYTHFGGKAFNEAIGVSKLGHSVSIIGRVGNDLDSDKIYQVLDEYGVEYSALKRTANSKTGQAFIFVQEDGESMISIIPGANDLFLPNDVNQSINEFDNASYCLIQTEVPIETAIRASEIAQIHKVKVIIKPSAITTIPDELLLNADIIIPNLKELDLISTEGTTMEEKARNLLKYGITAVVVTLGSNGYYIVTSEKSETVSAIPIEAVDTTGAGDAFISAFVSYLLFGYNEFIAARIANFAAGLSTRLIGTTASYVDRPTLESYVAEVEPELLELN